MLKYNKLFKPFIYTTCGCSCHKTSRFITTRNICKNNNPWRNENPENKVSLTLGNSVLEFSHGKLARFADGCAVAQLGDTSVMVTAVSNRRLEPAYGFAPLTVDYRQKCAAAGRIPTNYLRRDLAPSDKEILTGRMIDRSMRPLFPDVMNHDIQLICNLLAVDGENDPDIASLNAASAAIALSNIPWKGPIGAVRVGLVDNEIVINPTRKDFQKSLLNLVVSAVDWKHIVMLECSAENIKADVLKEAIKVGAIHCNRIVHTIKKIQSSHGQTKKEAFQNRQLEDGIEQFVLEHSCRRLRDVFTDPSHHKFSRDLAVQFIKKDVMTKVEEQYPESDSTLSVQYFNSLTKQTIRELIFEGDTRCDGRNLTDLRDISCEVDLYKPLHGSALFQRGQTQVLCTVTFDSPDSAAKVDTISSIIGGIKEKNFFLHYEFPPYATNDTGRVGGIGRRELGHGALAEKSLRTVIPNDFPFTIRLSAEVLESNGSSSMASACAGSLALMDAGVPIVEPVAGVAIGLISKLDKDNKITDYRLLTDILGIEDYIGDMDFKLAGTANGVTGLQADIKLQGLPLSIVDQAIDQAKEAHVKILRIMNDTISENRTTHKENRPVIETLEVPVHKISRFLGVGGYNLRKLAADTGVTISPEEHGKYQLFAPNKQALKEAMEIIEGLLEDQNVPELEFGAIYNANIVEIREFGIMVALYPNMAPALVHNSQLSHTKIHHPSALSFKKGDEIKLKYFGRDPVTGSMRLSRKVLLNVPRTVMKNFLQNENDNIIDTSTNNGTLG